MKKNRQAIIAKLIEENVISTQEELLAKLCEIYDATPDDIRQDVMEFLENTVAGGVVIEV